jgi:hypothetical protein
MGIFCPDRILVINGESRRLPGGMLNMANCTCWSFKPRVKLGPMLIMANCTCRGFKPRVKLVYTSDSSSSRSGVVLGVD